MSRPPLSQSTERFSSMSCAYFLSDVFWVFYVHRCLYFDLAAGCYSGEIQELASVKIVLNNLLPSFGGFFFFFGCVCGFWVWCAPVAVDMH